MITDIKTLKNTCVYSSIFGAILGFAALFPNIMPIISLFVLPFLAAIIVLLLMKMHHVLDVDKIVEMKNYAILGGIIGAISGFSFFIIFCPMVLLIHFFVKTYYTYGINFLNFFLAIVFLIVIMLIFITTNAAGGLLIGVLIKQFPKISD